MNDERIIPVPTALIQWAYEPESEDVSRFNEGYDAARRWVKMQIDYSASKASKPAHDVASVPDGFVMVPVKPTPEMLDCIMDWQKIGNVTAYRAMLAAAPKAEQPPVQEPLDQYDAGLLNDFGGGNVEWWQDYIRAELGRAHDFYQSQVAAPQPVSDDARDALVEALEEVTASLEWNAHGICRGINDGPIMLSSMAVEFAKEALATYRAAQEKPHD